MNTFVHLCLFNSLIWTPITLTDLALLKRHLFRGKRIAEKCRIPGKFARKCLSNFFVSATFLIAVLRLQSISISF